MERYKKEFTKIRKVLEENPKGLTIIEIAEKIDVNRNTTAKYLDLLQVLGHVEMKSFGPSKVFTISDRIPLSTLLNLTSEAIIVLDKTWRVVKVNNEFLNLIQKDREDILGKRIDELEAPLSKQLKLISDVYKIPDSEEKMEIAYKNSDGVNVYFNVNLIPIIFETMSKGLCIVLRNINQRKLAEERLKESERKYRTVFENTGTATAILEEDTTISLANKKCEELSGYTIEEIVNKKRWTEFCHPEDMERMKNYHDLRREDSELAPRKYEFRFITKSGEIKNILLTIDVIPETLKSVASLLDITEWKKFENQCKIISQNLSDLLLILNNEFIIEYINNNPLKELLGYEIEELSGKNGLEIMHPDDREKVIQEFKKSSQNGETKLKARLRHRNGNYIGIEVIINIFKDNYGNLKNFIVIKNSNHN
jgi:PAS domain S-box-containing protein